MGRAGKRRVATVRIGVAFGMTFAGIASASAQMLNPANGHYYQFVSANLTWQQARAAAAAMTLGGVAGHLATVPSAAEQDFIVATFGQHLPSGFASAPVWLGGFRSTAGWRWVTGKPVAFTPWAEGEPNNRGGREDAIEIRDDGAWNDVSGEAVGSGFIVEFPTGASANLPQPWWRIALASLTALAVFGPLLRRR